MLRNLERVLLLFLIFFDRNLLQDWNTLKQVPVEHNVDLLRQLKWLDSKLLGELCLDFIRVRLADFPLEVVMEITEDGFRAVDELGLLLTCVCLV